MPTCSFCGEEVTVVSGTSMVDTYCIDCHWLTIKESKDAIKYLQSQGVKRKRNNITNKHLQSALDALMNPNAP